MKILMTADAVGGVWTYAIELAAGLASHDIGVVLATMGPPPDGSQRRTARAIPGLELEVSSYKLEWMEDPWRDVDRAGEWLMNLAARKSVDAVHLNGYAHAALPWPCPVLVVGHSCVLTWWRAVHGVAPPSEWDKYRERVAKGLAHADCVVCPTQAFLESLRDCYALEGDCRVIRNARSPAIFESAEDHRLPIALACGRMWDEAKGLRSLDAIAADLPWPVYVAGAPTSPDGASRPSSLRCLGSLTQRDLALWMKRASIFVHPARYEPFGLAVLEAAFAGCALVLSDLSTLRELWSGAAVFVDAENPGELRRALQLLMGDPALCAALGGAARARAHRYEPGVMGQAYADLYRELQAKHALRQRVVA
jgi:glycogen synthase